MNLKTLLCKRWEVVECKEIKEHIRNELNHLRQNYDFIFSIGASCHCAMTLIAHSLRRASGPFDWVNYYDGKKKHFDNFEGNIELILNRFKNFMNIEDFEKISDGGIRNKRTKWCFWHDFAKDKDWVSNFSAVKEKYERRAERLLCNLVQADSILIVSMQDMMYRDRNIKYLSDDVISKSVIKIRNAYPMKKIEVLFVEDSVAELGVPYDSTKSQGTPMIYKKLFVLHRDGWLNGVMRYRIDFATITQMVQGEQGNLPLIPSLENLLGCVGLNKKIFMR